MLTEIILIPLMTELLCFSTVRSRLYRVVCIFSNHVRSRFRNVIKIAIHFCYVNVFDPYSSFLMLKTVRNQIQLHYDAFGMLFMERGIICTLPENIFLRARRTDYLKCHTRSTVSNDFYGKCYFAIP